jgi:ketosteroid isomerase-like protein
MQGESNRAVQLTAADMRRLIAEMLEFRMSAQYDRFSTYLDPGVIVYCNAWREGIVGPNVWSGASSLRDLFRRTDENYLPLDYEILGVIVDGDRAVVRWRGDWRSHATGKIYTVDAAHFLRWSKGLVVEMHEFFDAHRPEPAGCARRRSYESLLTPRPPGLSRNEMERRARKLVTFDARGPDLDLLRQWCSPDIVCEFAGDRMRVPYAGRHCGVNTMLDIIRAIAIDFDQETFVIPEALVEDDCVAGRRQVKWGCPGHC